MKSLVIAPAVPADAGNGLAMRIGMFVEALCALGSVDLLVLPVASRDTGSSALCRRLDIHPIAIEVAGRGDTQLAIIRSLASPQARLEAFKRYDRPSLSGFLSAPVIGDVRACVGNNSYDVIHIARSYLLPTLDGLQKSSCGVVSIDLDEDDAETYRRIGRLQEQRGDPYARDWNEAEAVAFDAQLARWLPNLDVSFIATVAERCAIMARFGLDPIVAANAVAIPSLISEPTAGRLLFVGGLGYPPNSDAALWLLREILPIIKARSSLPVALTLIGRDPSEAIIKLAAQSGTALRIEVDDLAPFYRQASIALVPLRAGGGSRIKLLEAAAYGVPVVSTTLGAENSSMEADIWIADTPDDIAKACLDVWSDPGEAARRAATARRRVVEHFSRPAMISTLKQHFANRVAGA